jgi:hypothetical protein
MELRAQTDKLRRGPEDAQPESQEPIVDERARSKDQLCGVGRCRSGQGFYAAHYRYGLPVRQWSAFSGLPTLIPILTKSVR